MVWKRLFGNQQESVETTPETSPTASTAMSRSGSDSTPPPANTIRRTPVSPREVSPQLKQAIERRDPGSAPQRTPEQRKLDGLRRQRMSILFDIEQGETAASPDNPWTQRMALLTEAMATVQQDVAVASVVIPGPFAPLPSIPIEIEAISIDDVATVRFNIGHENFRYGEDPDWADRSRLVTRGELLRQSGTPANLIPPNTPSTLVEPLTLHLTDSLFVLAADLRDRTLEDEPLPGEPTLTDLAQPCPTCGGWTDWRGTCQVCAQRQATLAALRREENRLLDERIIEAEERHKLVEGLPLAKRRLRDVEAELSRFGEILT